MVVTPSSAIATTFYEASLGAGVTYQPDEDQIVTGGSGGTDVLAEGLRADGNWTALEDPAGNEIDSTWATNLVAFTMACEDDGFRFKNDNAGAQNIKVLHYGMG